MGHDQDPNLNSSDKVIIGISMAILIALGLLVMGGVFLFGFAGLFQLFSVHYETKSSLVYYILCLFPLTILFELGAMLIMIKVRFIVKIRRLEISVKTSLTLLFIWIPLYLTDEVIKGITVPLHTELIATVLLFLLDSLVERRY